MIDGVPKDDPGKLVFSYGWRWLSDCEYMNSSDDTGIKISDFVFGGKAPSSGKEASPVIRSGFSYLLDLGAVDFLLAIAAQYLAVAQNIPPFRVDVVG